MARTLRAIARFDRDLCDGCETCVSHCPQQAIELLMDRALLTEERLCDGLGSCVDVCPAGAIRLERWEADVFEPDGSGDGGLQDQRIRSRLALCCRASDCGRICHRLVKQPGKRGAWCVDVRALERFDLYEALGQAGFRCPEGKF